MYDQFFSSPVQNFSVQRHRAAQSRAEFFLFPAGIFLLFLLAAGYIYLPNRIIELDYQIEEAKKTVSQLQRDHNFLAMKESEAASVGRLQAAAATLGLRPMDLNQVQFVSTREMNGSSSRLVALNPVPTGNNPR